MTKILCTAYFIDPCNLKGHSVSNVFKCKEEYLKKMHLFIWHNDKPGSRPPPPKVTISSFFLPTQHTHWPWTEEQSQVAKSQQLPDSSPLHQFLSKAWGGTRCSPAFSACQLFAFGGCDTWRVESAHLLSPCLRFDQAVTVLQPVFNSYRSVL